MRFSDWSSDVCSSDLALGIERHAEGDQPLNRARRALDDEFDDPAIVEPRAGDHRILDMAFERIAGLEHRGDSPLGPRGRAFVERALGEHRHLETLGEVERCRQSRRARTDDQDVAFRSEEHTSELQSLMRISYAVFCLKKKTNKDSAIIRVSTKT